MEENASESFKLKYSMGGSELYEEETFLAGFYLLELSNYDLHNNLCFKQFSGGNWKHGD